MSGQITDLLVSEQDLRDGYELHFNRYSVRKFAIVIGFALFLGVLIIMLGGPGIMNKAFFILGGVLLWAIVVLCLIVALNRFILIPRVARKVHAQQTDFQRPMTFHWDDEALTVEQTSGHWRRLWSEYRGWRRNDKSLLLYQSDLLFSLIPINSTTHAAIDAFERQLVAHNIPKK